MRLLCKLSQTEPSDNEGRGIGANGRMKMDKVCDWTYNTRSPQRGVRGGMLGAVRPS